MSIEGFATITVHHAGTSGTKHFATPSEFVSWVDDHNKLLGTIHKVAPALANQTGGGLRDRPFSREATFFSDAADELKRTKTDISLTVEVIKRLNTQIEANKIRTMLTPPLSRLAPISGNENALGIGALLSDRDNTGFEPKLLSNTDLRIPIVDLATGYIAGLPDMFTGIFTGGSRLASRTEEIIVAAAKIQTRMEDGARKIDEALQLATTVELRTANAHPRRFWSDIRKRNKRSMRFYFGTFVAVCLGAIAGAIWIGACTPLPWLGSALGDHCDDEPITHLRTAIAIALPTLSVIWLMKHVSRLFVQATHQYQDAKHRQTILDTYISLSSYRGAEPTKEERLIIFSMLASPLPSASGDLSPQEQLVEAALNYGKRAN